MRKKVFGKQLGRNTKSRKALFRSIARAMILEGEITTTKTKAKAALPLLEKLMTKASKDDLAARRAVTAKLGGNKQLSQKFFELGKSAKSKKSGFIRLTLLPPRKGDNAEMAHLEWTIKPEPEKKTSKKTAKKETKK